MSGRNDHRGTGRVVRGHRGPALIGFGLVLLWLLLPVVPVLIWAASARWSGTAALPQDWGTRAWEDAVEAGLLLALLRSLALGAAVAAIATPLGAWAGRALGWSLVRRPALPMLVLLAPVLLAPFAVAMGLDVVVLRLGIPHEVGVVLVLSVFAVPYTTFTLRAAYLGLDPALEDQARVLGASPGRARRRVTLPAASTGLVTATGLAFLVGWSDYAVTLLVGGGQLVTAPLLLGSAAAGSGNDALTAVLALSASVPPMLGLAAIALLARLRAREVGP